MRMILASSSPRRKALLSELGYSFEVRPSHIAEDLSPEGYTPQEYAQELAYQKALAIAHEIQEPALIIGADTIVVLQGHILGKPTGREHAFDMLQSLSEQWHDVITGLAFIPVYCSAKQQIKTFEQTRVKMKPLSHEEIDAYLDTDEPYDKAGSYAIQGQAGKFVEKIEGCYTNVIGLPQPHIQHILQEVFSLT